MIRNGYESRLFRMLEVHMAPGLPNQFPAILLDEPDDLTRFHLHFFFLSNVKKVMHCSCCFFTLAKNALYIPVFEPAELSQCAFCNSVHRPLEMAFGIALACDRGNDKGLIAWRLKRQMVSNTPAQLSILGVSCLVTGITTCLSNPLH